MWPILSFVTAFLETGKDVVGKHATARTNEYATALFMQLFGLLTLFPFLFIMGIPKIDPRFWLVLMGFCFTIPTANILYMRALKLSPLSIAVPMLAFNPIITSLLAIFFDHKYPTVLGWAGVLLVCVGIYCLRLNKEVLQKGILTPLLRIREEPGAIAMLGVSGIWAFGAHLSSAAVRFSSPLFATWSGSAVAAILLFLLAKKKGDLNRSMIKNHIGYLATIGILDGFSNLAMYTALSSGLTAYVVSIKRTNILWSSLVGKFYFHESVGRIKLFGLLVTLLGIVAILM